MKKITSAVLGLSLTLAAAGMSFAQTTTPPAGSKMDSNKMNASGTTAPAKKHKKAKKVKSVVPAAAPAAAPSK